MGISARDKTAESASVCNVLGELQCPVESPRTDDHNIRFMQVMPLIDFQI